MFLQLGFELFHVFFLDHHAVALGADNDFAQYGVVGDELNQVAVLRVKGVVLVGGLVFCQRMAVL